MATEANDSSTDDRDEKQTDNGSGERDEEQTDNGSGEKSQKEMAAEFEERKRKQAEESKRRIGPFQLAATAVLAVIALACFYLSQSVTGDHPLVQDILLVLGLANLVGALLVQLRRNLSRTYVLFLMPLTIIGIFGTFTNTTMASLLVCLLCVAVLYLMFRQPVLDEYDAPKE